MKELFITISSKYRRPVSSIFKEKFMVYWAIPEKIQTGAGVEDMEFPGVSKK